MHRLLERQLERQFGRLEDVPPSLAPLLDAVDASYRDADLDRILVERSLEITSRELNTLNADLAAKSDELRVILDSVPALIFYKDAENRILALNEPAAKALGRPRAELEGRSTYDLFPYDVAKRLHDDDLEVIRSGHAKLGILESHPGAGGAEMWSVTDKVPHRGPDGRIDGVVVLSNDVTKEREAQERLRTGEARLREAYTRLQEVDRSRAGFLNTAAHELGTPLTPIILQTSRLRGEELPEKARRSVEILARNVERLAVLVKDLVDSARLQTGRLRLEPHELELGTVAALSLSSFQQLANGRGVGLDFDRGPPLALRADPARIGQVFDNLVLNAIKFTPKGGHVSIHIGADGGEAVVRVKDTGIGIAAESMGRLFRPFTQVHDTMQETRPGTGLGLYICKGIVEAMGGRIACESGGPGKGTCFTVRLPLAPAPQAAPQVEQVALAA